MTKSPEPPAGLFSLFRRAPGIRQPLTAAGTWKPADRARAYQEFFANVPAIQGAGGELLLFDGAGAIACSMRVAMVVDDTGALAARVFGIER